MYVEPQFLFMGAILGIAISMPISILMLLVGASGRTSLTFTLGSGLVIGSTPIVTNALENMGEVDARQYAYVEARKNDCRIASTIDAFASDGKIDLGEYKRISGLSREVAKIDARNRTTGLRADPCSPTAKRKTSSQTMPSPKQIRPFLNGGLRTPSLLKKP